MVLSGATAMPGSDIASLVTTVVEKAGALDTPTPSIAVAPSENVVIAHANLVPRGTARIYSSFCRCPGTPPLRRAGTRSDASRNPSIRRPAGELGQRTAAARRSYDQRRDRTRLLAAGIVRAERGTSGRSQHGWGGR